MHSCFFPPGSQLLGPYGAEVIMDVCWDQVSLDNVCRVLANTHDGTSGIQFKFHQKIYQTINLYHPRPPRSTYDADHDDVSENILTVSGFLHLLKKVLRLVPGGHLGSGEP